MSKYVNALKLAINYIKDPYILLDNHSYSEEDHEHICFPYRLIGADFKKVCPYYNTEKLEVPEWSDCCDECKYLGIIDLYHDNEDKKNISFIMHKSIVEHFESIGE